MSKVLKDGFRSVTSSDAYQYGYGTARDYLKSPYPVDAFDWVITNPPFRLAEEFIVASLKIARVGVAMLTRSVFLESVGRYNGLFRGTPPAKFAQFVERVPMVKGRLDRAASTATGYAWLVWERAFSGNPQLVWIPPCRRQLELPGDYDNEVELVADTSSTTDLFGVRAQ